MRVLLLSWIATACVYAMHAVGRDERTLFDPHLVLLVLIVLGSPSRWILPNVLCLSLVRIPTTLEAPSALLFFDLVFAVLLVFVRHAFYVRGATTLFLVGFAAYWLAPPLVEFLRSVRVERESAFAPALLTGVLVPTAAWVLRRVPGYRNVFVVGGRR